MVEGPALREDILRRAGGARIARTELQRVVRKAHRVCLPQALCLPLIDFGRDRNEEFDDRGAEFFNILFCVAVSHHAVVAKLRIPVVSELSAHRVAQMHKLVVDLVQTLLVLLVEARFGLPRGKTARIVRVDLERRHLRNGVFVSLEGDLRRGDELCILGRQRVFALQLRNDLRREAFHLDLGVFEHQRAVFLLKIRAEGGGKHRHRPLLRVLADLRLRLVGVGDLAVVEFVGGVDVVADVGDGEHRLRVRVDRFEV